MTLKNINVLVLIGPDILYGLICVRSGCTATQQTTLLVGKKVTDIVPVYKNCMAYCILYVLSFLFFLSTIFRYGGLTIYYSDRTRILWNRIFFWKSKNGKCKWMVL